MGQRGSSDILALARAYFDYERVAVLPNPAYGTTGEYESRRHAQIIFYFAKITKIQKETVRIIIPCILQAPVQA